MLAERWESSDVAMMYDNRWVWSVSRVRGFHVDMHSLPRLRGHLGGDRGHSRPGAQSCMGDILPQTDTSHSSTRYL